MPFSTEWEGLKYGFGSVNLYPIFGDSSENHHDLLRLFVSNPLVMKTDEQRDYLAKLTKVVFSYHRLDQPLPSPQDYQVDRFINRCPSDSFGLLQRAFSAGKVGSHTRVTQRELSTIIRNREADMFRYSDPAEIYFLTRVYPCWGEYDQKDTAVIAKKLTGYMREMIIQEYFSDQDNNAALQTYLRGRAGGSTDEDSVRRGVEAMCGFPLSDKPSAGLVALVKAFNTQPLDMVNRVAQYTKDSRDDGWIGMEMPSEQMIQVMRAIAPHGVWSKISKSGIYLVNLMLPAEGLNAENKQLCLEALLASHRSYIIQQTLAAALEFARKKTS
jgi:hypothetical protein